MSISGLVLTLAADGPACATLSALAGDPRLTLGEQFGHRIAVVADTESVEADRSLWDELRAMPGIINVDVTFVHLDPPPSHTSEPSAPAPLEDPHAHC